MLIRAHRSLVFCLSSFLVVFAFPGQSVGICAVIDLILQTTGLSRNIFSAVYMSATITGCALMMVFGPTIDKFGIRKVTLFILALWTLVCFALGHSEFLYERFLSDFVGKMMYFTVFLYVNFSFLRFMGQSMLPMLGRTQIVKNFQSKQGVAIALNGMIVTVLVNMSPRLMKFFSQNYGWQNTYKLLALVSLLIFLVFFFCFHDVSKEAVEHPKTECKSVAPLCELRGKKPVQMPIFWYLMLTLILNAAIGSGTAVHLVDIFRSVGSSEKLAINSYLYTCCANILAGFWFGYQVDKNRFKVCVLAMLFCEVAGLIGLELANNVLGFWTYVIFSGGSWGGYACLMSTAWMKIFGEKHLGFILASTYASVSIVGAVNVLLMSSSKTSLGSYFYMVRILECVIVTMAIFVVKKFPKYC